MRTNPTTQRHASIYLGKQHARLWIIPQGVDPHFDLVCLCLCLCGQLLLVGRIHGGDGTKAPERDHTHGTSAPAFGARSAGRPGSRGPRAGMEGASIRGCGVGWWRCWGRWERPLLLCVVGGCQISQSVSRLAASHRDAPDGSIDQLIDRSRVDSTDRFRPHVRLHVYE